jgi:transcription elongation factor Elf1
MKKNIDHTRGLCGKPDVPENTPKKDVEKNPAHCLCCGSKMNIVNPESISMQQLGVYALVCPTCPKKAE